MKIVIDLRELTFPMPGLKAQHRLLMQCTEQKGKIVWHGGGDAFDVGKIELPLECSIKTFLKSLQLLADAQKQTGEVKVGEIVEVSTKYADETKKVWLPLKLLAILPDNIIYRYICENSKYPDGFSSWQYCRPIETHATLTTEYIVQTPTYKHCIVTITDEEG